MLFTLPASKNLTTQLHLPRSKMSKERTNPQRQMEAYTMLLRTIEKQMS